MFLKLIAVTRAADIAADSSGLGTQIGCMTNPATRRTEPADALVPSTELWPTVRPDGVSAMPTISRFFGIVIAMYFDDHGPPHFHARYADGAAKIRIDTLEAIESTLGRRQLRFVLAWAERTRSSCSRTGGLPATVRH